MPTRKLAESTDTHHKCSLRWEKCSCSFCGCCGMESRECVCPEGPIQFYHQLVARGDTCPHREP